MATRWRARRHRHGSGWQLARRKGSKSRICDRPVGGKFLQILHGWRRPHLDTVHAFAVLHSRAAHAPPPQPAGPTLWLPAGASARRWGAGGSGEPHAATNCDARGPGGGAWVVTAAIRPRRAPCVGSSRRVTSNRLLQAQIDVVLCILSTRIEPVPFQVAS